MNDSVLLLSLASAVVIGTPILLAGLGEMMTEHSGVMNLGVEGMMLGGGVVGFWMSSQYASMPLAMAVGAGVGALFALIHAYLAVTLRVNQIVSGLALVITGTGFAGFVGSLNDSTLIYARPKSSLEPVFGEGLRETAAGGPAGVRPRLGGLHVMGSGGGRGVLAVPDPGRVWRCEQSARIRPRPTR